jgi:phage protein D
MVSDIIELKINGNGVPASDILSLSFNDAIGSKSDKVSLKVIPTFVRPAPNDKIELIFKTFKDDELITSLDCGLFHVQTVTRSNNLSLSITATGVEFNEKQKDRISRHYADTKLSNIINIVAKRLGHDTKFKTDDLTIKSLNQTNETDINFLERLADDYNVLFSIKNDVLYFVNKDDATLPKNTVDINKCASCSIKHSSKTYYNSCKASWFDKDAGKLISVSIFDGTPVLKIKGSYKDKSEAKAKAKAKLLQTNKGIIRGSFSSRGLSLYAGTKVEIINTYKNEDDAVYSVQSCNHTWSATSGWVTGVEIEN